MINSNIDNPLVSVVVVCMNKPDNLFVCIDSIVKHTKTTCEILVVAYLFTKENMELIQSRYPWVKIIQSNEIRGFSENNNLALRESKGKYCFVVNDDTEFKMPVIDSLVSTIEKLPDNVAIVSPNILRKDGSVQFCGRPIYTWKTYLMKKLFHYNNDKSPYVNKTGVFKSYNILGAAFLIKRNIFEAMGWFDERFFFCPEDIALSSKLNNSGYECWVDSNVSILHYEGMSKSETTSVLITATAPTILRGINIYYSHDKGIIWFLLSMIHALISIVQLPFLFFIYICNRNSFSSYIKYKTHVNIIKTSFSKRSPKEIFIKYYNESKNIINAL